MPLSEIGIITCFLLIYIAIIGVLIANYIIYSLAMYGIAKKKLISHPWLAWIPVGRSWITGCITDKIDEENGCAKKWRLVLLIMCVTPIVAYIFFIISVILFATLSSQQSEFSFGVFIILYMLLYIFLVTVLAGCILTYICSFKIFEKYNNKKAVKYIILSLIVPFAHAICLNKCKKLCPQDVIMELQDEIVELPGEVIEPSEEVIELSSDAEENNQGSLEE